MKSVVLVSGGMDSFLAAHKFPKAKRLFINYGQPYLSLERKAVHKQFSSFEEIKVSGFPELDSVYVPARNLFFATIAVRFGSFIIMGATKSEQTHDKTPAAFEKMSEILTEFSKKKVVVHSPFWSISKLEAALGFLKNGGSMMDLEKTVSCYSMGSRHCGKCNACVRRNAIFKRIRENI